MLSVVVPAYNEGKHIYENLKIISDELSAFAGDFEIVVVNDGSKDNTWDEVKRAVSETKGVKDAGYEKNRGKGGAIIEGVKCANGDLIGFIDADLDLSPNHFKDFLEAMKRENADCVIGSKMHKESKLEYPPARKLFSLCFYLMTKILFGLKVKDTQTGVKLFKAEYIKKVASIQRVRGYAFDVEQLALISRLKAKIIERPIVLEFKREETFGRIKFKDIWKMFTDTIGVWWNLRVRKNYDIGGEINGK